MLFCNISDFCIGAVWSGYGSDGAQYFRAGGAGMEKSWYSENHGLYRRAADVAADNTVWGYYGRRRYSGNAFLYGIMR